MIRACVRQFRMGGGGMAGMMPIGLDFGAILSMGTAMGADQLLLAELLPSVEGVALAAQRDHIQEVMDDAE